MHGSFHSMMLLKFCFNSHTEVCYSLLGGLKCSNILFFLALSPDIKLVPINSFVQTCPFVLCRIQRDTAGKWQHIPHWRKNKWNCSSSCVCTCWCGNGTKVYTRFVARCVLMLAFFSCSFLLLGRMWWLSICKNGSISTRKCAVSLSSIGCNLFIMCFSNLSCS